ncbi:MAG: prolyl endopeptidase [Bryobacterales bacterium]|nr:prolyl endopeptidase [Bryobacterales bacterium]
MLRAGAYAALSLLSVTILMTAAPPFKYPPTRKSDTVEQYHGVSVADPYRWLEDDNSPETKAWVAEQNKVTQAYFAAIPWRAELRARMTKFYNYARVTAPVRRGDTYFFRRNDGLQNQSVVFVQKGLEGAPEVLLDPNKLSVDGTSVLSAIAYSRNGRYFAYGVSLGGSDWQEAHVMEVATRKVLPDQLKWLKATGLSWAGDGVFYSRYAAPAAGTEMSAKNEFQSVWFHKLGTPQSDDTKVFEDTSHAQRFHSVYTTEDEKFAILTTSDRGSGKKGNSLFYRDLSQPDAAFKPIVPEISDDQWSVIDNTPDGFLVETNSKAPNGRVALFNRATGAWKSVLAEKPEPLIDANAAGGKLFALYSKDVATHAYVYSVDGKLETEIALPGAGTASGFGGLRDDKSVFYSFTSLNYPPSIFRYDIATKKSTPFYVPRIPGFDAANYESKEVFVNSKDGTRVPMFIVHKRGLKLDGQNPAWITGYGGFNVTESPTFDPLRLALLEQGFVFASANMRGGGEYGEKWHDAGTKLNKQNVFDDFIACAEWLVANKYTSPEHFAANGTSNGGLLIGAVINQRPDLFRVAIPQAGVMDMLRYQKFTIGWNWAPDYGLSDNADEFRAQYAYSPIHNVKKGVKYPAVLITTADHDDRVVPAHSFKYAAAMQEGVSPERPALIRIETNSGHGASNVSKAIEIRADVYAFTMFNLGITPKLP